VWADADEQPAEDHEEDVGGVPEEAERQQPEHGHADHDQGAQGERARLALHGA
jgi:hypothetical protein